MKRAIRQYWWSFAVILGFAALSTGLGLYTLSQQRLQLPFTDRYKVRVSFAEAPGLAPGLGQAANVAGVRVGQVTGSRLVDGRAEVELTLEKDELPLVYRDATATLRPNTPLQDLQVDLVPGSRSAGRLPSGGVIAAARTTVPVAPGRFLKALDVDTRAYFSALLSAVGLGLDGRGGDLRELFANVGPTARQIDSLTSALAARREVLARTVSSLSALSVAAGSRDDDIRRVVDAGAATLRALASQDRALKASLRELPSTLAAARRGLADVSDLSRETRPTLRALRPATRALQPALESAGRLVRAAEPSTRAVLRPLVRTAQPTLSPLPPATEHLRDVTPDLSSAFRVLEYASNSLFYSEGGKGKGFPYWIAWALHNANSVASNGDALGQVLRGHIILSCSTLIQLANVGVPDLQLPSLGPIVNEVTKLVPGVCPTSKGPQ